MESFVESYNTKNAKKFIKAIKGHKFECFYKMIMAYSLSRSELLNLKWNDVDFENDTITIYPITKDKTTGKYKYQMENNKIEELGRIFPLLPCVKKLLLKEREKSKNNNFICERPNGLTINANTLSRNVRMIADANDLPQTLICGIKNSCHEFYKNKAPSFNVYLCWTRFDITKRKENLLSNIDLTSYKKFVNNIDYFIDTGNLDLRSKSEAEM